MAKLKVPTSAPSRDVLAEAPIELSRLDIEGQRPADPARDRLWRALRREVDELSMCGPFDLRHVLTLSGESLTRWYAERREWLREHFAANPRVEVR